MRVTINNDKSFIYNDYLVLNITIHSDYESMYEITLSDIEVRDNASKQVVKPSRQQGAIIYPMISNIVEHSFGIKPFAMAANSERTDNVVFKLNGNDGNRTLSVRNTIKDDDVQNIDIDLKSLIRKK